MRPASSATPLGVYVHFPWCLSKCPYCDFASFEAKRDALDHDGYAAAVITELEARAEVLGGRRLATVFFGGGTPSLWQPRALGRVLARVKGLAGAIDADLEVTVECNPSSLDRAHADALAAEGVNRLSVGVQGLDDRRLAFLGRWHDASEGLEALDAALASDVPRVSADLIHAVHGGAPQTPGEAAAEAGAVADRGLDHVSAYGLTIEPQTAFGAQARAGRLPIAPDERSAACFEAVGEALSTRGLLRYEISNHARPGAESRHNLGYWRGDDYLGVGCAAYGAHGTEDGHGVRYRNAPNPNVDLAAMRGVAAGRPLTPHEHEDLDPETRMRERIMLGLRLTDGVDFSAAAALLGVDPWPAARKRAWARLERAGQVEQRAGKQRVTAAGTLFTDAIASDLF